MYEAVMKASRNASIVCMSAAVADWRPSETKPQKEHKSGPEKSLDLSRTRDILADLCTAANKPTLVLGFAAETHEAEAELVEAGKAKMFRKGCDLLFVNQVFQSQKGFGPGVSQGLLLSLDGTEKAIGPATKATIADHLIEAIAEHYNQRIARAS
jgi:phosphopantothenoylcysteine decarboxylase/phosphopantothenate--cysteine ligase